VWRTQRHGARQEGRRSTQWTGEPYGHLSRVQRDAGWASDTELDAGAAVAAALRTIRTARRRALHYRTAALEALGVIGLMGGCGALLVGTELCDRGWPATVLGVFTMGLGLMACLGGAIAMIAAKA
jgi:hypothetical protein